MARFAEALLLFLLPAMVVAARPAKQPMLLQGKVYCDTCRAGFETPASTYISEETALILIRHGESLWNEKNLFTGCVDVPLPKKGVEEAIEAGKRISNIPVDMIYTSALIHAQMTAMLPMTQHCRKKVPIVLHDESEQARLWSKIFSEYTLKQSIPVVMAWQLNERMYGKLQGLNKQETAERYGKELVHEWRPSMTYLHQTERALKCVQKEPLPISRIRSNLNFCLGRIL